MVDAAFVIRTGPSGPDMPQSTPGNVLTVQADGVSVKAEPLPSGSSSTGQYSASAASNSFDTSATTTFVPAVGAAFAQTVAGDDITLTAAGCVVTYSGAAPQRFSVRVWVSINQSEPTGNATAFLGVDQSGDLLGEAALTTFADIGATLLDTDGNVFCLQTERVVTLAPGDTVQPALALVPVSPGTQVNVFRLAMVVEPVP